MNFRPFLKKIWIFFLFWLVRHSFISMYKKIESITPMYVLSWSWGGIPPCPLSKRIPEAMVMYNNCQKKSFLTQVEGIENWFCRKFKTAWKIIGNLCRAYWRVYAGLGPNICQLLCPLSPLICFMPFFMKTYGQYRRSPDEVVPYQELISKYYQGQYRKYEDKRFSQPPFYMR